MLDPGYQAYDRPEIYVIIGSAGGDSNRYTPRYSYDRPEIYVIIGSAGGDSNRYTPRYSLSFFVRLIYFFKKVLYILFYY
jgi:hypothetical protein